MAPDAADPAYREWASATDVSEYAYCPRAWYYRTHSDPSERTEESQRSSAAGQSFHAEMLEREWRREHGLGRYLALLLVGALVVLGGLAWIFW